MLRSDRWRFVLPRKCEGRGEPKGRDEDEQVRRVPELHGEFLGGVRPLVRSRKRSDAFQLPRTQKWKKPKPQTPKGKRSTGRPRHDRKPRHAMLLAPMTNPMKTASALLLTTTVLILQVGAAACFASSSLPMQRKRRRNTLSARVLHARRCVCACVCAGARTQVWSCFCTPPTSSMFALHRRCAWHAASGL